ncbi:2-dehydropantoate 2-reductase [Bacillus sp. OxB-1]|uniref:ketopantoate reductase family protein n=1 Tax=Bacillus sp. (strain OxB-1) TaxID=98228 RepID=UPI0005820CA4|nr:2-dehydropantoate 2-reductase [Bacillus sp. OxB-1]BAQ10419.1 2-dehydropantoate 2-reductase [Bacillus sp. OxB-1]
MKVVIAGAGSIGMLIGSYLQEAGTGVTFHTRRKEQADALNREGVRRVNLDGTASVFPAYATDDIHQLPKDALWIVCTKFAGLRGILSRMKEAEVTGPVLFIQNGIAHMELAYESGLERFAFATVEHGAGRLDDRTVSHNGVGSMTIAVGRGNQDAFHLLDNAASDQFPIAYHENAEQILMRKVLINCMINPLTALLRLKNGELIDNRYASSLFQQLYAEMMEAFPEFRTILPYEAVVGVCQKTASNHSSMWADRQAGRPMEIETIVTAVIRKAESRNVTLNLLKTLEQMLKAVDEGGVDQ